MNKENQESLRQVNKSSHDESRSKDFQKEEQSFLDANELKDGRIYKCLLIVNESKDAKLTLYIYPVWSPLCLLSNSTKIIQQNEKYLHRQEDGFKFKLVANLEDERKTKKLLGPLKWIEDKLIKVTEALDYTQENLANFPVEKQECLRKIYIEKELRSTCGNLNPYEVLGLEMKEVRKMEKVDEQKAVIWKAFLEKIKTWHLDKNSGDHDIAMEIIVAKEILLDDERRALYHNYADYNAGWLSRERYKAIFWPERYTEKQKIAYWRRLGMNALSFGVTAAGGIALTVLTAGAAAPIIAFGCAAFAPGVIEAGVQSMHALNKKSDADECDGKPWLEAAIQVVGDTVAGDAGGGAALESTAVTAGQFVGIGAETGAVGGFTSSLASDAEEAFVDRQKITAKQALLETNYATSKVPVETGKMS